MEVIFIKDLKKQAKKGEIKKVKDGYAQNFLIKNGYAVVKNKENLLKLQQEQAMKIKEDELAKNKASMLKTKLDKLILEFKVKTGEQDKVFGSISVKQIKYCEIFYSNLRMNFAHMLQVLGLVFLLFYS